MKSTRTNHRPGAGFPRSLSVPILLLLFFLPRSAGAVPLAAFQPSVTVVAPNQDFDVQVWISGVDTISNYQVYVQFDPSVIEFVQAVEGSLYLHTYESDDTWFFTREESSGTHQVFDVIFPAMSYVLPPGELTRLTFHSIARGYSPLSFVEVNVKNIRRFPLDTLAWENGGVYVGDPTGIGRGTDLIDGEWKLGKPYPNPTRGASSVLLGRPAGEERSVLAIYDVRGRLLRALAGRPTGRSFEITWDGRDSRGREVVSGVYFYRLNAPGRTITRKVYLVR